MAIEREEFFDKKSKGALWDVGVSIKRSNPLPLDADSVFASLEAAQTYAASVISYPGQVIAVIPESGDAELYYLDQACALKRITTETNVPSLDPVIGSASDGKEAITIHGARAYAKDLVNTLDGSLAEVAKSGLAEDVAITSEKVVATDVKAAIEELADAVSVADGKAVAAQEDVDALEAKVGTVAEGKTVIGLIGENADAISGLDGRLDTAESDINTVEAKVATLIGSDANKSARQIANEEIAAQLIAADAAESLDTLAEIAAWIQDHPDDAAAMNRAIEALEALVGTIPVGEDGLPKYADIVAMITGMVGDEATRAQGVENTLSGKVATLESKFGTGEGTVESQIAAAKSEAIAAAAEDATTKAGNAQTAAQNYADGLNATMSSRVEELEGLVGETSVATQITTEIQKLDSTRDQVADATNPVNLHITIADGKVTELTGSIKAETYDDFGSAAAAQAAAIQHTDDALEAALTWQPIVAE